MKIELNYDDLKLIQAALRSHRLVARHEIKSPDEWNVARWQDELDSIERTEAIVSRNISEAALDSSISMLVAAESM